MTAASSDGTGRRSEPSKAEARRVLVEICTTSVDDVIVAEAAGADRVEVCAGLVEGGTTPSYGLVRAVLGAVVRVGVQVLIRPRGGDFLYTESEVEVMTADISAFLALARSARRQVGFVLGALTADGNVDAATTAQLVAACDGAPVTFHRAFDLTADLGRSLDVVASLGVRRVLTGGGCQRAVDGADTLAELVRRAKPGLSIMAGGAVRAGNVGDLVERTRVSEVHLRAAREVRSAMAYTRRGVSLSSPTSPKDDALSTTSAEDVAAVCQALSELASR